MRLAGRQSFRLFLGKRLDEGVGPVRGDLPLRFGKGNLPVLNLLVEPTFKPVLLSRVPLPVVGLWPEILDVVGPTQLQGNQMVHFARAGRQMRVYVVAQVNLLLGGVRD